MKKFSLPDFDERDGKIEFIILHATAYDLQTAVETYKQNKVSAHYLIDAQGKIYQLVDDDKRAWHAGVSYWKGQESLNKNSIGIELLNETLGQTPFTKKQILAVIRLGKSLKKKYHINKKAVLGHFDVAPLRKADPGKAFPFEYLARHGLGLWYNKKNAGKVQIEDEKVLLEGIGYDVRDMKAAKVAFCRHFLPESVGDVLLTDALLKPAECPINVGMEDYLTTLKAVYFAFNK